MASVDDPTPGDAHPSEDLEDGRPHRPADDREEVYYEGIPLLRAELGMVLVWVLVGVILIAAPFLITHFLPKTHAPGWLQAVLIILGLIALLIPFVVVRATRYRVTNYRIDYERGILSKRIDTLELWHVEDIQFHQSLFDRILNCGDITIISHDETTPRLKLYGLSNPRPLYENIKQRVIAVKRQRGVVKMDIG